MADGVQVPEDLSSLSPEDLDALLQSIQQRAGEIADAAKSGDEAARSELQTLLTQAQTVRAEGSARAQAAAAAESEVADALGQIMGNSDGSPVADEEPDMSDPNEGAEGENEQQFTVETAELAAETETVAEVAAEVPVGLTADETPVAETVITAAADEADVQPTVIVEAGADTPVELAEEATDIDAATADEASAELAESGADDLSETIPQNNSVTDVSSAAATTDSSETQEAAVAETSDQGTPADSVVRLSNMRPRWVMPPERGDRTLAARGELVGMTDLGAVDGTRKGQPIDVATLARDVAAMHQKIGRMPSGYDRITLASARADFDVNASVDSYSENLKAFRAAGAAWGAPEAIVASGGNCSPLPPNYDVFTVAQPMSPVEDGLPTVGAPRGGIRYLQPPSWTQAAAGVRLTTEAQDAAGYTNQDPAGSTAPKPCVHLECSSVLDCQVDAVSQCVTFGNLQYRTFPEQVEVFLEHLAVAFAQAKEISYLDTIQGGSTATTFNGSTYGAIRTSVRALAAAAHAYRKRNHMPVDAVLDAMVPDTMIPILKVDAVADAFAGIGFLDVDAETVARMLFERLNIRVTFYYDYSTSYGAVHALQQAQVAGALNALPGPARIYLFSPGTWIRLDGGTLDVGIVRDSTLNSTNDLQMFAEEWVQACKVGIESVQISLDICPNGAGPAGVTPFSCAS